MIFSPIRKRVDELAYGLGDLIRPFLVEKPHGTNSPLRGERPPRRPLSQVGN